MKIVVMLKEILYNFIKRVFDIFCTLIGLILLIPLSLVIKTIYVSKGDFHSIFFSQTRIGKNGKKFKLHKFRTMIPNAEEKLQELLKEDLYKKQWDKNQKIENDPRITKVGRVLRKYSIDEIPQFINVLIGNMSLVGPRPLVEGELDRHKGNHKLYESVKPGITGLWASNGREKMSYKRRLKLEYYYIKNRSIFMDLKCVFRTIKVVLKSGKDFVV